MTGRTKIVATTLAAAGLVLGLAASPARAAGTCTVALLGQITQRIEFDCDPFGCPRGRSGFASCVHRVLASPDLGGPANPCEAVIHDNYVKSTYCLRNQNAVPCFQTNARGEERCRIVPRPEACRAPRGGSACTSFYSCATPCS